MAEQITIDVQTGKTTVTYVPDNDTPTIDELLITEPTIEERVKAMEEAMIAFMDMGVI